MTDAMLVINGHINFDNVQKIINDPNIFNR